MIDIDLNAVGTPFSWAELFGREQPADIEIGCGKGRFLNAMATTFGERSLLGVERAGKYHKLCCERAARRGLGNVRLLRTTAEDLLFRLVAPASVANLFVLFPDPWPKKRHHKRRLITAANVAAMARALAPGGKLLVKSDHPAYAEVIDAVLADAPGLAPLPADEAFAGLPLTGFEVKYRQQGRPIYAWAMRAT